MLPTTGHFKDIECPFYDDVCDRPYCHFRHKKKNVETTSEITHEESQKNVIPTYKPTPKSQLAITRNHIPISYVPDLAVPNVRRFDRPIVYKPTPISVLNKQGSTLSNDNSNELPNASSKTAEYNPVVSLQKNENFNFEDLSTEFDLIDDIISDFEVVKNGSELKTKKQDESNKLNSKTAKSSSESSKSKDKSSKSSDKKHSRSSSKSKSSSNQKNEREKTKSSSKKEHSSNGHKHSDKKSSRKREEEKTSDKHSKYKKHKHKEKSKQSDQNKVKSDKHDKSKPKEVNKQNSASDEKSAIDITQQKSKENVSQSTKISKYNDLEDLDDNYYSDNSLMEDNEDLEDDSTLAECYRIFNEYKPDQPQITQPTQPASINIDGKIATEETTPFGKKRIAHDKAEQSGSKIQHTKVKPIINPAQMMTDRFKLARMMQGNNEQKNIFEEVKRESLKRSSTLLAMASSRKLKKVQDNSIIKAIPSNSNSGSVIDDILSSSKKPATTYSILHNHNKIQVRRIAPVSNVNSIQEAKAKIEVVKQKALTGVNKTSMQTITKGNKRVAHIPEYSLSDIPDVLHSDKSKLPVNVRTRYLTMLVDECIKLYLTKEDAYQRALNEEYKCYERCKALPTYRNSTMLSINRIRKEVQEREKSGLGPISANEPTADNDKSSDFKGRKFYENIKNYVLSEEELDIHGYPRESIIPGKAVIKITKQFPKTNLEENQRICARCSMIYVVDEDGFPVEQNECVYHPLKKRTLRGERTYLCCKSSDDFGCVTSHTHVCETTIDNELEGFQTTMDSESDMDSRNYAVYALDCEMCYTTRGLELTRVTIVDVDLKTVYESLVKPLNPIIDYNTRFSGITKEQMDRTSTSILQVQANILHLCNSKTILIGHSLESDMKALKIIHSKIIDTAVLFPHKFGLPHKRALRALASEYLKKIIQNDISGHDSAEDALTCMELVIWKVKEELKLKGLKS